MEQKEIIFNTNTGLTSEKLYLIKLDLLETLELLKEVDNNSAAKEFCDHNIKKAIKWLERINGNGNSSIPK